VKLKHSIESLRKAHPKCSAYGQLHSNPNETKGAWGAVILWTLFVSDEGTHLLLPHRFKKSSVLTARQWRDWFTSKVPLDEREKVSKDNPRVEMLEHIHHRFVLPGINIRTNKFWQVEAIIGWIPHVVHVARNTAVSRNRNKANSKRRKNG
jgi:hypothetical protein